MNTDGEKGQKILQNAVALCVMYRSMALPVRKAHQEIQLNR